MRGRVDPQESMFSYFSPDSRVPEDHPLRRIKQHADVVLASMNPEFDRILPRSAAHRPAGAAVEGEPAHCVYRFRY